MQKTKYGVNHNSTVCDIVIIVIAVFDPFCLQKELKVFRWDGGGVFIYMVQLLISQK